jgi:hypothetical protein
LFFVVIKLSLVSFSVFFANEWQRVCIWFVAWFKQLI